MTNLRPIPELQTIGDSVLTDALAGAIEVARERQRELIEEIEAERNFNNELEWNGLRRQRAG